MRRMALALLRARRKRPRRRRAAEKRDELAPPQMIQPHLPPEPEQPHCILIKIASPGQWDYIVMVARAGRGRCIPRTSAETTAA